MDSRNIYTSVGCNASCQNVDWSIDGLIVYGASYSCVVLEKNKQGLYHVKTTYTKHTAKVNTVKWISRDEFISGGDDSIAYVWKISSQGEPRALKGHTGSINFVDSVQDAGTLVVATAASDGTVRLWKAESDEYASFQSISLGSRICLAFSFALIPNSDVILLALSTTDNNIELLKKNASEESHFVKQCKLVGHENWVRGLDFVRSGEDELMLASASQDGSIRLWRLSTSGGSNSESFNPSYLDKYSHDSSKEGNALEVNLESILQGHEDWVFSVHWCKMDNRLQMLSASIDKSVILWQQKDNIWSETARLGVIGGNASGFFGAKISTDGQSVMGYGFLGSLYFWKKSIDTNWQPLQCVEGHSASVSDLSWEKTGKCLISVSADKTSRVHAASLEGNWHVVARPQVHGFGLQCVAWIDSCRYLSGAEEKVIRVFQAAKDFIINNTQQSSVRALTGTKTFATVQNALGLSNKIVSEECDPASQEADSFKLDSKLWPETHKLYGHCHEIFAIACSPDLKYVASSAKAVNPEDSCILVWDVNNWKIRQKLTVHSLTVTNLQFSRNSRYLLAVSRDRRWSLYAIGMNGDFTLMDVMDKSNGVHNRVIWCCDWSHDDRFFITSSRDGKLAVWGIAPQEQVKPHLTDSVELKTESITACAFGCSFYKQERYLIAIGTEKGLIKLFDFGTKISELFTINACDAHHLTVRRLRFSPETERIQLASCGEDNLVRVNELCFLNS